MKITEAIPRPGHKLFLRFDDDVAGEVDLSGLAGRGVFAKWQEAGVFERVCVTEMGAVEWPGELDLCPDALYLQLTGKAPEAVFPNLPGFVVHA